MIPSIYRTWAKKRLRFMPPWVKDLQFKGMFAGVPGWKPLMASYHTALLIEHCSFEQTDFTGAAVDTHKHLAKWSGRSWMSS